jgi:hypothetical protein
MHDELQKVSPCITLRIFQCVYLSRSGSCLTVGRVLLLFQAVRKPAPVVLSGTLLGFEVGRYTRFERGSSRNWWPIYTSGSSLTLWSCKIYLEEGKGEKAQYVAAFITRLVIVMQNKLMLSQLQVYSAARWRTLPSLQQGSSKHFSSCSMRQL